MASPLVSVLVAAYNAELWLGTALRSAIDQTWPSIEVVVVDDGSTDGTAAVAQRHASDAVKVIRQENRGACAARNRAFAESRGAFVQYLDADDVLAADKIERQMECLEREPEDTVAYSSWSRFTGDIATADTLRKSPDWRDYEPASNWLLQAWEGRGTSFPGAWLIPRQLVERAGPWNEGLLRNQDGEFMTRVLLSARKVKFCPEAWAYYRADFHGSVSKRVDDDALRSLYDSTLLCEQAMLEGRGLTPETRHAIAGLYQQFLFTAFPSVPDLVHRAEARVEELGGMYREPGVSRPLYPVREVFGWKAALRLQRLYARSGVEELVQKVKSLPPRLGLRDERVG